jgi:predicted nucleic acid-binding protein
MSILLDTNILARLVDRTSIQGANAAISVAKLLAGGETIHLVPQILYEFWAVATRPIADNGLGMSAQQAKAQLDGMRSAATLLSDNSAITEEWEKLVLLYDVKGRSAHYARLVAAMMAHGISSPLTFNGKDFSRYPGITLLDPSDLTRQEP